MCTEFSPSDKFNSIQKCYTLNNMFLIIKKVQNSDYDWVGV